MRTRSGGASLHARPVGSITLLVERGSCGRSVWGDAVDEGSSRRADRSTRHRSEVRLTRWIRGQPRCGRRRNDGKPCSSAWCEPLKGSGSRRVTVSSNRPISGNTGVAKSRSGSAVSGTAGEASRTPSDLPLSSSWFSQLTECVISPITRPGHHATASKGFVVLPAAGGANDRLLHEGPPRRARRGDPAVKLGDQRHLGAGVHRPARPGRRWRCPPALTGRHRRVPGRRRPPPGDGAVPAQRVAATPGLAEDESAAPAPCR